MKWHDDRFRYSSNPVALLEHDSAKPARKRRGLAQLRERPVRLKESFLRRIFGKVKIVEQGIRVTDRHILKSMDERGVGGLVSCQNRFDQWPDCFHSILRSQF